MPLTGNSGPYGPNEQPNGVKFRKNGFFSTEMI